MTTSPSLFYLFASDTGKPDQSTATVFYKVEGESLAKSLCTLFTREYADAKGSPAFSQAPVTTMSPEEQILLDETLDALEVYDDPDPGIYDPEPSKEMHTLAQYGVRARKWEDLLRDKTASEKPGDGSTPATGAGSEQALVIARAKSKRVLAELTSRAHTEVAKTLSNSNLHGMLFSSKCLLAVGQVAESTAKELVEKVTSIYVDTVGSDLPKDTAVISITKAVDEFYAEFKSKHQSRFAGLMGTGAQILGKLDEKIAALKASLPEGVDIALFDAKKQTGATGSPSADQGEVSEEEAKEALRYIEEMYKEFAGRYHVFPLVRCQTGRALLRTIEAGEAILRDYPETLTPKQSEVVAWLLDYLVEYADYHDLLDMSQRMSHEAEVAQKLNELKTLGLGVFVGSYPAKQVFDNGKSLTLTISVILIAATDDPRIKHQADGTEFIQGAIPKRKKESGEGKGASRKGAENATDTKDDLHRVAANVEALGAELREFRQAMAAIGHETPPNAARLEQETPRPHRPSPLQGRIMKGFDWITNGLSAATAAMSTAPPDQWADGRVVGVATSTFLLGAIQARRAEHENRSRDEVIAAVRKGLEDLERRLSASESEKAAWTDTLKKSLSEQLTAVALSVEGCQGRIADLDKSVGSVLDRVARVEEFVHAHARGEAVLVKLVDWSFTDLSLPAQNLIHDILDDRFTKEHLSVLAERCGVDWDNLAGETKSKKAMELIKECRNSGRFAKLIGEIERKRPGAIGLPKRVADLAIEVTSAKPKPK